MTDKLADRGAMAAHFDGQGALLEQETREQQEREAREAKLSLMAETLDGADARSLASIVAKWISAKKDPGLIEEALRQFSADSGDALSAFSVDEDGNVYLKGVKVETGGVQKVEFDADDFKVQAAETVEPFYELDRFTQMKEAQRLFNVRQSALHKARERARDLAEHRLDCAWR